VSIGEKRGFVHNMGEELSGRLADGKQRSSGNAKVYLAAAAVALVSAALAALSFAVVKHENEIERLRDSLRQIKDSVTYTDDTSTTMPAGSSTYGRLRAMRRSASAALCQHGVALITHNHRTVSVDGDAHAHTFRTFVKKERCRPGNRQSTRRHEGDKRAAARPVPARAAGSTWPAGSARSARR